MHVLVTGHKGYIGSVMVPMLIGAKHKVVGLDSDLYQKCTFGDPVPEIPYLKKDIRDVAASDLEGFDAMVHLAALSNDPLGNLDPKLDSIPSIIDLKVKIEKLKTVAIGQIAPDFTQNDPEGNPVKFSDIYSKNELTLLDFWAAWCGPCRGENPNVVAVYNDYKDKGFTVFGVSLDREKDAWLKAIEDDGLTWTHVSDLSYWQNAAAQLYAVSSIPHSLLVDKTGKIIAKDKREDELRKAVSEFLEAKP